MTRFTTMLLLFTLGCQEEGIEDTAADSTTDDTPDTIDDTAAGDGPILEEGEYTAAPPVFSNDTCSGGFEGSALAPVELVWVEEDAFELRYAEVYNVSTIECTVQEDAVTCGGFTQVSSSSTAVLTLTAETNAFTVASTTSFEIDWSWTMDCEGDDCTDAISFPCTIDVLGLFSQ